MLYTLPEHIVVFKGVVYLAQLVKPREVGAHGAADKGKLLKIHVDAVLGKELRHKVFKAYGLLAGVKQYIADLLKGCDVHIDQPCNIVRNGRVRRHEKLCIALL